MSSELQAFTKIIQADHNASLLVLILWVLREVQSWYWNRFHRRINVALTDINTSLMGVSALLTIKEGEKERLEGIARYHKQVMADAAAIKAFRDKLYSLYPELQPELKEGDPDAS